MEKITYTHDQMADILSEISLETVKSSAGLKEKKAKMCEGTGRNIFMAIATNCFGIQDEEEFNRLKDEAKEVAQKKIAKQMDDLEGLISHLPDEAQKIIKEAFGNGAHVEIIPMESKTDSAVPEGRFDA